MIISKHKNNLTTEYIVPERIIISENCERPHLLLEDTPCQATFGNSDVFVLKAGGFVVLDFGEELHGGAVITVRAVKAGVKMRVVFGESVTEAMSNVGERGATNDHSLRDIVMEAVVLSTHRVGATGFRFLKLEGIDGDVEISCVKAAFVYLDAPIRGSFESDDERFNKIWKTAVRTTHLNMQEYLWDGIKRDRLVWIGDMHVEVSTVLCAFGANDVVNRSLDIIRDETPADKWMGNIASYSMWWLIIHRDWYLYTGDISYLMENKDFILFLSRHILSHINDDGTDVFTSNFVDWETKDKPEMKSGFYSVLHMALNTSAYFADIFGDEELKEKCLGAAKLLRAKNLSPYGNKQVASLMALSGLADINKINNEVLKVNPLSGLSSFTGYYTLLAKGMAGDVIGAVDAAKIFWGAMLDLGATTFWESFDLEKSKNAVPIDQIVPEGRIDAHADFGDHCYKGLRHSLCHGWASGPAPFAGRYILGVNPIEPGFKKVSVKPDIANFKYIHGTFPTPHGDIEVTAERKGGKVISDIKVPDGVELFDSQV